MDGLWMKDCDVPLDFAVEAVAQAAPTPPPPTPPPRPPHTHTHTSRTKEDDDDDDPMFPPYRPTLCVRGVK